MSAHAALRLRPAWPALAGSAIAAATALRYIAVIRGQGAHPDEVAGVAFFVTVLVAIGVLMSVGALSPLPNSRLLLLAVAGTAAVALGLVARYSIGLPLLLAGALALGSAWRARLNAGERAQAVALMAVPLTIAGLVEGIALTG